MNAELKKERAIDLIVSIFHYGKFKAETPNEKELETILRELRLWPTSESEIVKRSEWYESQPLTEGEGDKYKDEVAVSFQSPYCSNKTSNPSRSLHHAYRVGASKMWDFIHRQPQQESNKEEVRMGATGKPPFGLYEEPSKKEEEVPQKILINGDIIGICKKGFRVTKEECIGCERGVKHVCIPEPSKKPVCYCGHPKERHFVQYKSLVEGNQLSCRHCECFEYADNELHNQGEI